MFLCDRSYTAHTADSLRCHLPQALQRLSLPLDLKEYIIQRRDICPLLLVDRYVLKLLPHHRAHPTICCLDLKGCVIPLQHFSLFE